MAPIHVWRRGPKGPRSEVWHTEHTDGESGKQHPYIQKDEIREEDLNLSIDELRLKYPLRIEAED